MRVLGKLSLALSLLALLACDRAAVWDRPLNRSSATATDRHLSWLVAGAPALALFDPLSLKVEWFPLEGPSWNPSDSIRGSQHPSPNQQNLLLLHGPRATWLSLGESPQIQRSWVLPSSYSRVSFSPEGHKAILHHTPGQSSGEVISNPNQILILDLESDTPPLARSLRAFGAEPGEIKIDPLREVAGRERQLAWILAERYLAILDLERPESEERVVHLELERDERQLIPLQLEAAETGSGWTAFVRVQGSDDIFSLAFSSAAEGDEVPRPHLNQLAGGQKPSDMLLQEISGGLRLFSLSPSLGQLSIIEPDSGTRVLLELGTMSHFLPFKAADEGGEEGNFSLLWQPGNPEVIFVDLDQVEAERGRALTRLRLDAPVDLLLPLSGQPAALAQMGSRRLALLDFEARTAMPLSIEGEIEGVQIAPDGAHIFALVRGAGTLSTVMVDVATGTPSSVELGRGGGELFLCTGVQRLVVDHSGEMGEISVLSVGEALSKEGLQERSGLMLEGILDQ